MAGETAANTGSSFWSTYFGKDSFSGLSPMTQTAMGLTVASAAMGAYFNYMQGAAERNYQRVVKRQLEFQAQLVRQSAEIERENNIDVARGEADKVTKEMQQTEASQIAAIAAAGGDISSQAAQNVVSETFDMGVQDLEQINENLRRINFQTLHQAEMEALGLEAKGKLAEMQGEVSERKARASASLNLLEGFSNAFMIGESYRTKTGTGLNTKK